MHRKPQVRGESLLNMNGKTDFDPEMDVLEDMVASQAMKATHSAYIRALSVSRDGVLCVKGGELVRVAADGTKTRVANAKPRRKVAVGQVITVRRMETKTADGRA
jgi:hypothetical protein